MFKYSLTADKESNEVLDEMLTFYTTLNGALQYPSLILAIGVHEIEEFRENK